MKGRAFLTVALCLSCLSPSLHAQPREERDRWFDLPVPGGWRSLGAFGITREEQAVTLPLLVRRIHGTGGVTGGTAESVQSLLAQADPDVAPEPAVIPVPLSADTWRSALEADPRADTFQLIAYDRSAALIASGLAAADPSVRVWLDGQRGLLRWLHRTAPGAVSVVGRSLAIDDGRFRLPGDAALAPAWQAIVGQPPGSLEPFLRNLLTRDAGRLAWFFDTMMRMSPERLAAIVPAGPPQAREETLRGIYASFRDVDPNWKVESHPYLRGVADTAAVLATLDIDDGQLAAPNAAWLWSVLFDRRDITRDGARGINRSRTAPVDIAWLTREIVRANPRERGDRFEMVRLAQRVFAGATAQDMDDVAIALSSYHRFKGLLLTLERLGVRAPAVWSAAVEAARVIDAAGDRGAAIASFQGVIAVVDRAHHLGAIGSATAERLVAALFRVVLERRDLPRTLAGFITGPFASALPPLRRPDRWTSRTAYESTIMQALAGEPSRPERVEWEGLTYELDLAGSELARLHAVRGQLPSPGLDAALDAARLKDMASAFTAVLYATALGDPDGAVALSPDIAARHDLGADSSSWMRRELQPWLLAREQMGDGGPWRVSGSLLGLEFALSRLSLRRVQDQEMPPAPTINLNDHVSLARTVPALQPQRLTDGDRAAIVAAISRGRARVAEVGTNLEALVALAREAVLSAHVIQALPWMARHTPAVIPAYFPPSRLLWLGAPELPQERLDLWGVFADSIDGRLTTVMTRPVAWEDVGGRADLGQVATLVPDLTLRLAEETERLQLPAPLVPALLAYAVQDYWHEVEARFADDWPAMARAAAALSARRVEDYVAALAGRVLR